MASTPHPMPVSIAPAAMSPAMRCTACWAEPHWASRVWHPAWTGIPALSQAVLVTFPACSPACVTQPPASCSTWAGVDSGPLDDGGLRPAEYLCRVQPCQRTAPLADRGPDRLDNHRSAHASSLPRPLS